MKDNDLIEGDKIEIINWMWAGTTVTITEDGVIGNRRDYEIDSRLLRGTLDFVKVNN
jgi:hypothetical protein